MNPLWFLPSLVIGAFYAFSSGNWMMLTATVLMFAVSAFMARKRTVLSGPLVVTSKNVFIGDKKLPSLNLFWTKAMTAAALESLDEVSVGPVTLRDRDWRAGEPDSYAVGVDHRFSLASGSGHLLVIGPTGSGKSELIHLVLASVDRNVRVLIADYKGGAVLTESPGEQGVSDLDSEATQIDFWQAISEELSRREHELKVRGVASIDSANRVGVGFPRLVLVVDEVVAAIRMCPASLGALTAVATRGRSLGIHLLVTSQSLVGIPRELLINLRNRLALAGTDEVELLQLGFKEKFKTSAANTKAALFSQDGSNVFVSVPLGVRPAPRQAG